MSNKKNNKPFKGLRLLIIVASVFLVAVLASALVIHKVYQDNLRPTSQSQRGQQVTIPLGSSTAQIASTLKQAGVIRQAWAFEWYVRINDLRDKLQAGTYLFRYSQSLPDIATIITHGKVATDLVTILPAQRLDQIRQTLINSGFGTKAVSSALDPSNYDNHPALVDKPVGASLEGYLYPDTWQKTAETNPRTIVQESLDEMQKHLTPGLRAAIVRQGLTVHQGVILASIVEQEAGNNADKPTIAQVFLLRFRTHMVLGSDVTAIYGSLRAGQGTSLSYNSPYNTRINGGLPPGPISNVSESSLQAVAHPAKTKYLYFVAGDDGVTYFSKTLAEHESLTAQHCKKLCQ